MTDVFENPWLLLTLAALAIVPAAIVRQTKPAWGYRPLLVPLLLAALGLTMDYAVQTDKEQIHAIIRTCRAGVVAGNVQGFSDSISPDYDDGFHRGKTQFMDSAEQMVTGASIEKVKFQEIRLTLNNSRAEVEIDMVVHLNSDSRYAMMGSVIFVSVRLECVKPSPKQWYIQRVQITSVNNQPVNWGDVR